MLASNGIIHHLRQEDYDPQTVTSLLATHTIVTGRCSHIGQLGELYVLMFPLAEGRQYFQEMHLEPHFLYIPDTERLLLLYIGQYVTEPYFVVDSTLGDAQKDADDLNGHHAQLSLEETSPIDTGVAS